MLDEMTPEQFAEWQAYYTVEPFGDDWEQTAVIAAEIRRFMQILLTGLAGETLRESQLAKVDDFIPGFEHAKKKKKRDIVDDETFEAICKAIF